MNKQLDKEEFDAIIVGSGPAGASLARELSKRKRRVLILERGGRAPLREGFLATASILSAVRVGDNLAATRALTTGGTTAVYFAVAQSPPVAIFRALGIDLTRAVEEAKLELPLTELPDALVGAQTRAVRESALELGYPWKKRTMLVDLSKCPTGYAYESKWHAGQYALEAVLDGATLINRARVVKVVVDQKQAIGVEYRVRNGKNESEIRQAFGAKIILCAGSTVSPVILQNSGIRGVSSKGFYCHPSMVVFGVVSGLKAGETFAGSEGADLEDDEISVGDANLGRTIYRMFMLRGGRWIRACSHSRSIAVGVMVRDGLGGALQENGRYHKDLAKDDLVKLERGERIAWKIVQNAGGKHLFKTRLSAGHVGGTIGINEHVDEELQTEYRNLYVCDGSVIPASVKVSPTLTLICLGKYLANRLSPGQ